MKKDFAKKVKKDKTRAAVPSASKIEVSVEPEIQYAVSSSDLFEDIYTWMIERQTGANSPLVKNPAVNASTVKVSNDRVVYRDDPAQGFPLLRNGIEYRVKEKPGKGDAPGYRHDIKTPQHPNSTKVVPDENGILWRHEIKCKTGKAYARLAEIWNRAVLEPHVRSVANFFDLELKPLFYMDFNKRKIDHASSNGVSLGRIEYSFQTGRIATMDGTRQTSPLYIVEIENKGCSEAAFLAEKKALEDAFASKGLHLLDKRKVLLGFELLLPDMTQAQRESYDGAIRNSARDVQDTPTGISRPDMPILKVA